MVDILPAFPVRSGHFARMADLAVIPEEEVWLAS